MADTQPPQLPKAQSSTDTAAEHATDTCTEQRTSCEIPTDIMSSTIFDNKETQNNHDPPCASPSTSSAKDGEAQSVPVIHTPAGSSDTEYRYPLPELSLQTYFNPNKPNLAKDFKVPGLRPILREDGEHDNPILTDDKDRIYVWNEMHGRLTWVRHKEIEELESVEDKVDFVLCGLGCLEVEPVYDTYHPADDPKVEEMREAYPKYRI